MEECPLIVNTDAFGGDGVDGGKGKRKEKSL